MNCSADEPMLGRRSHASGNLLRPDIRLIWISLPLFFVAWIGLMQPLRLLDFWWHLKAGEVIVASRAIPQVDAFSFTFAGQPFGYAQYWLGEVIYYITFRLGGLALLIALNAALLVLAIALILHLCLEATDRMQVAVLCCLAGAVELGLFSNMRPQTYAMPLFAAFYWVLWRYREGRADHLWLLPFLMVLWVNVHGTFVLGIALIVIVFGAEVGRRAVLGERPDTLSSRALARLVLTLAFTAAAAAVNPEGLRVFVNVWQLQVNPAVRVFITEWQAPDLGASTGLRTFIGPFFLATLVFLYSDHLSLTELGLYLAMAILGLQARRNGIWFALAITPMVARHLAHLDLPHELKERCGQLRLSSLFRRQARTRPGTSMQRVRLNQAILSFLALFTVLLSPWVRPNLQVPRLRTEWVDQSTPVRAMDYIARNNLQGNIFHVQSYGDYLIWRLWPQQRSFFDGRVHLFDATFVQDYLAVFRDPNWELWLANYGIRYLLLPKADPTDPNAAALIRSARELAAWRVLYEDQVAVLFERVE
jgi:hypothetical protein